MVFEELQTYVVLFDRFEDFYRREFPGLHAVARAISGDADSEDLVQDTMFKAFVQWDRIKRLERPGGWCHCANLYGALEQVGTGAPVIGADLCFMDPAAQTGFRQAGVSTPIPPNWYMFSAGWDPTGQNDTGYEAFVETFGRYSAQPARAGVNSDNDGFAAVIALVKVLNQLSSSQLATKSVVQSALTTFAGPMLTQFGPIACGDVQPWGASAPIACAGYIGAFTIVDGQWSAIANGTNGKLVGANGVVDVP